MKVLFLGSSHIGGLCLESLITHEFDVVGVITQISKKKLPLKSKLNKIINYPFLTMIDKVRNSVFNETPDFSFLNETNIKHVAEKYHIPVFDTEILTNNELMKAFCADVIVVASFGKLLTKDILELPKNGCINLHPSFLPEYRGGCPSYSMIKNGDKIGGVTIHKMNERFDEGDILYQKSIELHDLNCIDYEIEVSRVGKELLALSLNNILNNSMLPIKQSPSNQKICYANKDISCLIDWNDSAHDIILQIRASYHPNTKGAYSYNYFSKIYLINASFYSSNTLSPPGNVNKNSVDGLIIQAKDGEVLISKIFYKNSYISQNDFLGVKLSRLTKWHLF
jgi:methionyl-tRNA formyltransferase